MYQHRTLKNLLRNINISCRSPFTYKPDLSTRDAAQEYSVVKTMFFFSSSSNHETFGGWSGRFESRMAKSHPQSLPGIIFCFRPILCISTSNCCHSLLSQSICHPTSTINVRQILQVLAELVILQGRKLIIWCSLPAI